MFKNNRTLFLPTDSFDFQTVMEGVEVASVVGNHADGNHGTLVKLAPGVRLPLHHYTADLSGIVVAGRVSHPVPGREDSNAVLDAGSFFSFANGEPHETKNMGNEPSVFFIMQSQAWEFVMD